MVKANVAVKNAIVSGVVVGNINATESVELTQEGRMVGDIRAPRVIIVDGASFRGRVDMGELAARPEPPRADHPAAPSSVPRCGAVPPPPPPARRGAAARPGKRRRRRRGEEVRRHAGHRPRRDRPPDDLRAPPAPPVVGAGAKKKVVLKKKEVIAGTFPWAPRAR